MKAKHRVAFIGAGLRRRRDGSLGYGMAYGHAPGYVATKRCDIVAVADIVPENAQHFAERFGVPATYTDYKKMLREVKPDIVSICTWTYLHPQMVLNAVKAGVKAIHCEKPMAPTWGEAKRMHEACVKAKVQLTFNHQRRFLEPFRRAKELAQDGTIGRLVRLEAACDNMIDWGTHWIDMMAFYNNDTPVQWVLGQIDSREYRTVFKLPYENQAISTWVYANGVRGLIFTGWGRDIGCENRLVGTEGTIEVHNEQPHVRVRGKGSRAWKMIKTKEHLHGGEALTRAVVDVVESLETGREPELSSHRAIQTTEVIFATYESSRRRGRVDLPLDIEDSPFLAMLEAGDVGPNRKK